MSFGYNNVMNSMYGNAELSPYNNVNSLYSNASLPFEAGRMNPYGWCFPPGACCPWWPPMCICPNPTPSDNSGCCCSTRELVTNGGMEEFTAVAPILPIGWSGTGTIAQTTTNGTYHMGNSAADISDGATISQDVTGVKAGCHYEFGFFANQATGTPGISATVTFTTTTGETSSGGTITVAEGQIPTAASVFSYYRIITSAAPTNVAKATIAINVPTTENNSSIYLDDVSFAGQ